ncbi:hypothetical protein M378DRAFT_20188, partial [Amanita muscaria Koide BX008]
RAKSLSILCLQARNVAASIKTGFQLCPNDSEPGRISGTGISFSRYRSNSCFFARCNFPSTISFNVPSALIAEYEDLTSSHYLPHRWTPW